MNEMPAGAEGIEVSPDAQKITRGGGTKTAIIAMVAVLVLAFQIVSSHLIVKMVFFGKPHVKAKQTERVVKPKPPGEMFLMESILINPVASRGSKHLLVELSFEVSSPKVIDEMQKLSPILRDNIITLLSSQSLEVLTNIMMREKIREKIKEVANFYLTTGTVEKVYFNRYVFP